MIRRSPNPLSKVGPEKPMTLKKVDQRRHRSGHGGHLTGQLVKPGVREKASWISAASRRSGASLGFQPESLNKKRTKESGGRGKGCDSPKQMSSSPLAPKSTTRKSSSRKSSSEVFISEEVAVIFVEAVSVKAVSIVVFTVTSAADYCHTPSTVARMACLHYV
ncbi:hypothetical protein L596_030336 [Steinernema carpocapsae]|uniref:Uncharacterized protein n=1 Tax=Steinernema carpocapsae TaxID=34508 RepID=A0A4U5LP30_STECR|nr:hypothetical protein L596_030336 [Steinernema carpocapsae]